MESKAYAACRHQQGGVQGRSQASSPLKPYSCRMVKDYFLMKGMPNCVSDPADPSAWCTVLCAGDVPLVDVSYTDGAAKVNTLVGRQDLFRQSKAKVSRCFCALPHCMLCDTAYAWDLRLTTSLALWSGW